MTKKVMNIFTFSLISLQINSLFFIFLFIFLVSVTFL